MVGSHADTVTKMLQSDKAACQVSKRELPFPGAAPARCPAGPTWMTALGLVAGTLIVMSISKMYDGHYQNVTFLSSWSTPTITQMGAFVHGALVGSRKVSACALWYDPRLHHLPQILVGQARQPCVPESVVVTRGLAVVRLGPQPPPGPHRAV